MDSLILLSLVALGIPLLTFVLIIFNQAPLKDRAHLIALPGIAFSAVLAFYVAWVRLHNPSAPALEWGVDWIRFGTVPRFGPLVIRLNILFDNVTSILMAVVTGVSLLVNLYSVAYMRHDVRYARYFAFLSLFTFAMLGVLLAGNFLQLYMFWELVGFASYVLIAHWYEQPGPQMASRKAFIANRIGDAFLWIGILLLFAQFHTFDLREIFGYVSRGLPISFSLFSLAPETTLTIAGLLLFGGAIAKSAQFPLHVWLPDAMEGPTPVSALIHAATMVAAGVYLMARVFPILSGKAMFLVACTGAFTSVLAATIAITQRDIKKVLAYSTISQLGLMIMSIGSGAVAAGMFHLVTHAAFKACLFLGAGSVIQAMHRGMDNAGDRYSNDHDIFNMGGLFRKMPITGWTFIIGTLAITGLPLTAGFLSKDEILTGALAYGDLQKGIAGAIPWVGFAVTLLTALYMWREVILVFFGKPALPDVYDKIKESSKVMTVPLIVLASLTVWFWFGKNPIDATNARFLNQWIKDPAQVIPPQSAPKFFPRNYISIGTASGEPFGAGVLPTSSPLTGYTAATPMLHQVALAEHQAEVSSTAKILALSSAVIGLLLALILFQFRPVWSASLKRWFRPIYVFSYRGWFFDPLYEFAVVNTTVLTSRIVAWGDHRILDGIVNLAGKITVVLARIAGAFDKYIVDGIVTLTGATIQFFGLMARSIQTGRIQTYLLWVVAAIVVTFVIIRFSLFHL